MEGISQPAATRGHAFTSSLLPKPRCCSSWQQSQVLPLEEVQERSVSAAQLLLTIPPQAGDTGTAAGPGAGAQADHLVTRAGKEDFPSPPREQEPRRSM